MKVKQKHFEIVHIKWHFQAVNHVLKTNCPTAFEIK